MKVKLKDIEQNDGQLKGLPRNPRYIKDDRFEALKQSLQDDPEMTELRELVVFPLPDKPGKYIAIGGNMRLRAMKALGWKEAEAIVLKEETPIAKLREYVHIDNFNAGRFDWDALANEWEKVELQHDGLVFAWEAIETLDDKLFSQDHESGSKGEKEGHITVKVHLPHELSEEDNKKAKTIIREVISKYPGAILA